MSFERVELAGGRAVLYLGDCLEVLPTLAAASVDAVVTDPPYGTTACPWDSVIPTAPMWEQVERLLVPSGAFVTTACQPFTSALVMSKPSWFVSEHIWRKPMGTNYLNANREPMKNHESVLVFADGYPTYNPQMRKGVAYRATRGAVGDFIRDKSVGGWVTSNDGGRYPLTVIDFNKDGTEHPTQKPVKLYRYLVLTYTNAQETVCDIAMGSGTTGVACIQTGRRFIGIEIEPRYFEIAVKRIEEAALQPRLFDAEPTPQAEQMQMEVLT